MKTKLFTYSIVVLAFLFSANSIFAQITVSLSSTTNVTCGGNCDGSITVTGVAGTPPYTYSWSPGGMTTATVNGLCAGTYTVIVTDAVAAIDSAIVAITSPSTLTVGAFNYNICQGGNAVMSASPVGGNPPYTYSWAPSSGLSSTNVSSPTASPATTTIYTLTVTDNNGCIVNNTFMVTVNPLPTITISASSSLICLGASSTLTASGALTYTWNTGAGGFNINVTPDSTTTYMAIGTTAQGCINNTTHTINIIPPASVSTSVLTSVSCLGGSNGSALAQISANQIQSVMWDNGETANPATQLNGGIHTVIILDTVGCSTTATALITTLPPLFNTLTITSPSCGISDGTVTSAVSGGTAPYTYFWSNASINANLTNVGSGIYSVDVTDVNGCLQNSIAVVGSSSGPLVTLNTLTNITCTNADNGVIAVSISGGTPPYAIRWNDMAPSFTSLTRTNLQAGPYELIVTDANGCQTVFNASITEPTPIVVTFNYTNPSSCVSADGAINSSATGGVSGFTYLWSNAATTSNLTGLVAGVYSLTVTDVNGCINSSEAFLNDNTTLSATGTNIPTNCGTNTGSIDITVLNGSGSYSYLWSNSAVSEDINSLFPGNYGVTITDISSGCATALQFMVSSSTANYAPQVCMVTIDSLDEKNVIIWERPIIGGIKEFVIYRETSQAGIYRYIGTNSIDSLTQMKDTVADADLHAWKYKISAIDSCGVETGVSEAEHRPIYLTVDTTTNGLPSLVWTNYIGRPYSSYTIKRNANSTGWVDVAIVPSTQNTFVDANCPSGSIEYTIEALFTSTCEATRGAINTTRSNIKTPTSIIVGLNGLQTNPNGINLFPNPSQNDFTLSFNNKLKSNVSIEIMNALGMVVSESVVFEKSKSINVNTSSLAPGIYFVRLSSKEIQSVIKFIKH